jgi:transcriptional regulator with XRE-family HTH domain
MVTVDLIALGSYIRERRKELGLSQKALAEKMGIFQPDVSVIENAQVESGLLMVARLAVALEMKPSQLASVAYGKDN